MDRRVCDHSYVAAHGPCYRFVTSMTLDCKVASHAMYGCTQEQVCGVRHEAGVQEVLREVSPGAEEAAEEAGGDSGPQIGTWPSRALPQAGASLWHITAENSNVCLGKMLKVKM